MTIPTLLWIYMKIVQDQTLFDEKQEKFATELVRIIKQTLTEQGLDEQTMYDLTSELSFNLAALLDGTAVNGAVSDPAIMSLAFREKEHCLESIVVSPAGSHLHELSEGLVEEAFD